MGYTISKYYDANSHNINLNTLDSSTSDGSLEDGTTTGLNLESDEAEKPPCSGFVRDLLIPNNCNKTLEWVKLYQTRIGVINI